MCTGLRRPLAGLSARHPCSQTRVTPSLVRRRTDGRSSEHNHTAATDLLGDFVVLFCWRISRKPATPSYPYGYGKYESLGTLVVAVLLVLGGFGIGASALVAFSPPCASLTPRTGLHSYNSLFGDADAAAHSHSHSHSHSHHDPAAGVDPNAAWFALGSILVKEWLYRASASRVARVACSLPLSDAQHFG
jgi:divalent metal cation (Fe/Co/Zn/Cd) transporter